MWDLLDAVQRTDVIECVDTGRQTSVETEDLVIDESGQGEIIEEVGEKLPDIRIAIFTEALVVETIHLCDLSGLVVASQYGDPLGISDLQRY